MPIIIATVSIFIIVLLTRVLNKMSPIKVCAICAGVSGTWFWILAGVYLGLLEAEGWRLIAAIAMGGSVVGVAYQMEKRLADGFSSFLWKILFIPAGFAMIYSLLSRWWEIFSVILTYLILIGLVFWRRLAPRKPRFYTESTDAKKVEELEDKMKNCC